MGSFRKSVPVVFLSPDAAWVARLVAQGMEAVAWSGDPEQWPAVAQALKGTHVIIWPDWRTGQEVKAPRSKAQMFVKTGMPPAFNAAAWAKACMALLAGVAGAVHVMG